MNYVELEQNLFQIRDEKFAAFSKSLSNSEYISIGVKMPILKGIIKEHLRDEDLKLEDFRLGIYLEVDYIYFGLALLRLKTIDEQFAFIKKNAHKAKSWSITDTIPTFLKKHDFEEYFSLFNKLYQSKYTYDRRLAYILGLKHYRNSLVLEILDHINLNEEYMVMMGEAWLLATIAIRFPNEVYNFLKDCPDLVLKRKTISKISDSFRIDETNKNLFKSLR